MRVKEWLWRTLAAVVDPRYAAILDPIAQASPPSDDDEGQALAPLRNSINLASGMLSWGVFRADPVRHFA
jgi:hypothetical protein